MPICFITDTELDFRALSEMGLTAKPNTTTPIGKFGTGLKYTVAGLVRLRIPFKLFIGTTEYEFYEKTEDFRGTTYHPIYMRKRKLLGNWSSRKMPFNTNYGAEWELWMIYRELHANTLDEQGMIGISDENLLMANVGAGKTVIAVYGKEFEEVWRKRDEIFLPWASYDLGLDETDRPPLLEYKPIPSKHVYFRGLRVYTASKPFANTYNILSHLSLTEDRAASFWGIMFLVARHFATRCQDPEAIHKILQIEDSYSEKSLDWDYVGEPPSEAFGSVVKGKRKVYSQLTGMSRYYDTHYGKVADKSVYISEEAWDIIRNTIDDLVVTDDPHDKLIRALSEKFGRAVSAPELAPDVPEEPKAESEPEPEQLTVPEVVLVNRFADDDIPF